MNLRTISIVSAVFVTCTGAVSARAQQPAVQEPTAQQPAAQEPTAQQPAAQEPTAQPKAEPAAQQSVAQQSPDPGRAHPEVAPTPQIFLKEPASAMFGKTKVTLINFIEFDAFHDSTQSFQDSYGGAIARSNVYAGQHGRTNFLARNTQFGLQVDGPEFDGMKPSGHCRMDFNGQQPGTPQNGTSEYAFQTSATARLFHCYASLQTPYVDVLGGLTYTLFGNQPYFFPASLTFLGIPGEIFVRTPQFRLSHQFTTPHVDVFVAAAAARPPQRDAELPDGVGALRVLFNDWKGAHTLGAVGVKVDPAAIGISGEVRKFRVQEQTVTPVNSHTENGAGISLDALIPIIPSKGLTDVGNTMTATAAFTTGYGISDSYTNLTAGAPAQTRLAATGAAPYAPAPAQLDIDPGLAYYDPSGVLHAVNWQSINVGLQYRFPGPGNIYAFGNYTYLKSGNLAQLRPPAAGAVSTIFKTQSFAAGGIGWAIVPNFQMSVEYSNLHQTFLDEGKETNNRISFATYYVY